MNNKGFAITSVIYGLSVLGMMIILILMGTISSSRKNVREQAEHVEDFLIHMNKADGVFTSSGTYTVPNGETGWYRVEAFGKSNATYHGSYTTGIIYAEENNTFNIVINNTFSGLNDASGSSLMKAGAATSAKQGGGLKKCYSTPPTGAVIKDQQLMTTTLTGTDAVTFSDSGCNLSYIKGYPSQTYNEQTQYFVDGLILAGASGVNNGKVIITKLAGKSDELTDIPRKNTEFDDITKIEVGTAAPATATVSSIYYSYHVSNGTGYKSYVKSCSSPCSTGGKSIDDIAIFFTDEKVMLNNVVVELTKNSGDRIKIYSGNSSTSVTTAGPNGLKFSAYQTIGTTNIDTIPDHGNYYIIPVTSENKVVTAPDDVNSPLLIDYLTGDTKQKWSIDLIDGNYTNITNTSGKKEFRIMELSRYKAMGISLDENKAGNTIAAMETFNALSRNDPQIWNITSTTATTFSIKSVVPSFNPLERSGFLYAAPSVIRATDPEPDNNIYIGTASNPTAANDSSITPTLIEGFYLYSLDFSK